MKTCWAQYLFWLVILVLGAGSALSACGQKGDLYLPQAQPAVVEEPLAGEEPSASEEPSANKEPAL